MPPCLYVPSYETQLAYLCGPEETVTHALVPTLDVFGGNVQGLGFILPQLLSALHAFEAIMASFPKLWVILYPLCDITFYGRIQFVVSLLMPLGFGTWLRYMNISCMQIME